MRSRARCWPRRSPAIADPAAGEVTLAEQHDHLGDTLSIAAGTLAAD